MKIYEATVKGKNGVDPDYENDIWNVAVLTDEEERQYYKCEEEEDYNKLVRKLTKKQFSDEDINFYVNVKDLDTKKNQIDALDYLFVDLVEVL